MHTLTMSRSLLEYYDSCLLRHGDTASGAAWPDDAGRLLRFKVGLELMQQLAGGQAFTVCDLGCGTGEFYRYLQENCPDTVSYIGVDRSAIAIAHARAKFPEALFHCADILDLSQDALQMIDCDMVFANGLFTVKHDATHAEMWRFLTDMLETAWPRARRGVIFNVMSTIVDWERDDLFHVSYDALAQFLVGLAGRTTGFRADYGLYEIMAYAGKPVPAAMQCAPGATRLATVQRPDACGTVPVCKPLLPTTQALLPYLARIDGQRRYSNHGALVVELTERMASTIGAGAHSVCLASSGTAGLTGSVLALAGRATPDRPLALCPAYTFVATALAVELAGYQPYLVDVDPHSWALEPHMLRLHPQLHRTGLVVVAAPFGQAFSQQAWADFSRQHRIPVVIDAAASFENVSAAPGAHAGDVPVVLSLHATKSFSTAEGGAVMCTDADFQRRLYGALNFGFSGARSCSLAGMNGKMSEYHAAVGLAEHDCWPGKQAAFHRVAAAYRHFARQYGLEDRLVTTPRLASCYALFVARGKAEAIDVNDALFRAGVDTRNWYGAGLQHEPYFRASPADPLPNAGHLAACTIGLPMAPDMTRAQVDRVMSAICAAIRTIA